MKNLLKKLFYKLPLFCQRKIKGLSQTKELKDWMHSGKPIPPPHMVKQLTITEYQRKYNIQTLVETGTYLGDMIVAQLDNFQKIISIELDNKLYHRAVKRFEGCTKVNIIHGDSGEVLQTIVFDIKTPAIFWLDGHYSGGDTAKGEKKCPIYNELAVILQSPINHILLIDDARLFVGKDDYPTIHELSDFIFSQKNNITIEVKDDIIRVVNN